MKLILFFNGWGMNKNFIPQLKVSKNCNVEIIDFPYEYEIKKLEKYEKIYFAGWSFGAWYLSKFIIENEIKSQNIVGINGHGEIIGEYGIKEKMIDFTIKNLTEKSLLKFYKNMGISNKFIFLEKDFLNVKEELLFFKKNYTPLKNIFTKIIAGNKDRIIPFKNQKKYCCKNNIKYIEKNFSHFPFEDIKGWKEIFGEEI